MEKSKLTFNDVPEALYTLLMRFDRLEELIESNYYNSKSNNDLEVLTRNDVKTLFGISLTTVHAWVEKGILKPFKMGNKTYFLKSEVETVLLNSNTGQR